MKITIEQRKALSGNPNVLKITDGHIVYTAEFKIEAVEANLNGESADLIFARHKMSPDLFPARYCDHCLKRWRAKYKSDGKTSLRNNERGKGATGRPRESLDDLSMDDLKAIIFVQQDMINEIKKMKALAKKK